MIEGSNHIVQSESDQELESAAVAGAAAVQRLIADRNNLRNRVSIYERELTASHATQEDLKRRLGIFHQRYIELARKVVSQLEQFDVAFREVLRERPEGPNGQPADATGPNRQFDVNGLPPGRQAPGPSSNGVNGITHGKPPLPLEP